MPALTDEDPYFEEREKEKTAYNELFGSKLTEIIRLHREIHRRINRLKEKAGNEECLELLEEIDTNTIAMFDLYGSVLQLVLDLNHREFKLLIERIGMTE